MGLFGCVQDGQPGGHFAHVHDGGGSHRCVVVAMEVVLGWISSPSRRATVRVPSIIIIIITAAAAAETSRGGGCRIPRRRG